MQFTAVSNHTNKYLDFHPSLETKISILPVEIIESREEETLQLIPL